ncbi:MAG TPA: biopolymer transporter ExbD, partial [Planctomycetota bacterium]|nr:biopolymer transporter ExbD [Planctomycetota bacterium]
MRINQKRFLKDEELLDMTPMIDVVFQLLIFFLLSAKFIALETQIQSFLPKDQGLAPDTPSDPELVNVTFELSWIDDGPGEVICQTFDYRTPGSGDRRDVYRFQRVDGTQTYRYGPEPKSRDVTFG